MKKIFSYMLFLAVIISCSVPRKTANVTITGEEEQKSDSISYELVILDPGFESWFVSHARPVWYHSQSYLETWNLQYVSAWNSKTTSGRNNRFFETFIDYRPNVDYGLELNHRLFYYFQYVEKKLKIPILPSGMSPQSL